jgi:predicted ester cyclase
MVVTRWTARGTHQGDLLGITATGKQATVTGITIDRFAEGRVIESRTNWNTLGLLQQLGVVPALAVA